MHIAALDLRTPPPRLSLGVLAIVILIHAAILAVALSLRSPPQAITPPSPLFVRMIEPAASQPEPVTPPEPPKRQPTPTPAVARPLRQAPPAEAVRHESMRPEPPSAPVPAPAQAPVPIPAPAPAATEAPKPVPPPPLPVTQPRFSADYLDNPKPSYPALSRRMGEEGEVRLRVHVDAAGNAQQVEVSRSSGFPRLDQAALDTVRQWRFVPARQGDQPIPAWVIVPIQFSLRS